LWELTGFAPKLVILMTYIYFFDPDFSLASLFCFILALTSLALTNRGVISFLPFSRDGLLALGDLRGGDLMGDFLI
jgi:hypothetical protein